MEKTYRFVRRFNPLALAGLMLALIALVMMGGTQSHDPTHIVTMIAVLVFAGFLLYRQKAGMERALDRRLVLNDAGLRYEISKQHYSLDWNECDHHVVRLGRDGEVRMVMLVTREGEWLPLNRLEDMPGILAVVRQHVPASGGRSLAENLLLNPWFSNIVLGGLCLLGFGAFALPAILPGFSEDQAQTLALVLFAPVILVTIYIWRRNPLLKMGYAAQQGSSSAPRGFLKGFLINLVIWVAIVLVVLLVLYFMPQKR